MSAYDALLRGGTLVTDPVYRLIERGARFQSVGDATFGPDERMPIHQHARRIGHLAILDQKEAK